MTRTKSEYARLCGTAKSRMDLCGELRALAHRCGATIEQTASSLRPRSVFSRIRKGDFGVQLDLDGDSRVDAFLAHWYVEGPDNGIEYPRDFNLTIRGTMNTCHWRKATICQDTWAGFLACLEAGLNRIEATP